MADRLIGYARASRWDRGPARDRLEAQVRELEGAAHDRSWRLQRVERDLLAGRTLRRPGLQRALEACRSGEAQGIVVTSLDRLSRSLSDLAELFGEARAQGFAIVALDTGLDTRTGAGDLVATVLADAGQWTRRDMVRERAREALATGRERRRRGRPSSTPPALAERIRRLRADGETLQSICDTLNAEGVPTPRGGSHWRPTSLRAVLRPRSEGGSER